jgi:hypothetical protein
MQHSAAAPRRIGFNVRATDLLRLLVGSSLYLLSITAVRAQVVADELASPPSVEVAPTDVRASVSAQETTAPAEVASTAAVSTVPAGAVESVDTPVAFAPDITLHLFSDVNFAVSSASTGRPSFALGGVDFFITGAISSGVSFLSENVLEFDEDGGIVFDLERIYLEVEIVKWLSVRAGREHIPMGRYMSTYHHALLFQWATARPQLLAFEDEGGFLPAHQIGLEAFGKLPLGDALLLGYTAAVGNGRGQFADDILNSIDRNGFKAVTVRLTVEPLDIDGLEVGVSGYMDRIPKGFTESTTGKQLIVENISELIGAFHVAYLSYPFELMAVGYLLAHRGRASHTAQSLSGGFVQLGVTFNDWTPYARFEYVTRSSQDTFFNVSGTAQKIEELRLGLRFGLNAQAVVKVEYIADLHNDIHAGQVQAAFGI